MRNRRPEPSVKEFLIFTMVYFAIILAVANMFDLSSLWVFIASGIGGWYARDIIYFWKLKFVPGLLTIINNWAKK